MGDIVQAASDAIARPAESAGGFGLGMGSSVALIVGLIGALIGLAIAVFYIICWWRIYAKAGRPGWAIFVPVYCWIEFFNITWGNGAYFLFMFIPGINVLVAILTIQKLSEAYGHGLGFTIGQILLNPIFIPLLAFGPCKHVRYEAKKAKLIPTIPGAPDVPLP